MEGGPRADERGVGRPGEDQGIEGRGEAIVTLGGIARGLGGLEGRRGEWEDGRGDQEDVEARKRRWRIAWGPERRLGGSWAR